MGGLGGKSKVQLERQHSNLAVMIFFVDDELDEC
jgi:hypothetical protein